MVLTKNKGFSLIELMIVIAIIGILVAVALPQFASMSEDAKKTKAKQDCDTIVQAVTRFNSLEGVALKTLDELAGKYITNIKELKDPWGNAYLINTGSGFVFSMGPDGQSPYATPKGADATKKDDIKVPFIGELMLTDAILAVDVGPSSDSTVPGDTADALTLTFNKTVAFSTDNGVTLCKLPGPLVTNAKVFTGTTTPTVLDPYGGIFDWYVGTSSEANKVGSGTKILNKGGTQTLTMYQSKDDSREIIVDIDHHSLSTLVPNYHHINITAAPSGSQYFFEDGTVPASSGTVAVPAKRSGVACKIRRE